MSEPDPTPTPPGDATRGGASAGSHRRRPGRRRSRRRPSVVGVLGEVLVTAGVLVLMFLGWQVWWNSMVVSAAQSNAAAEQSKTWLEHARSIPDVTPTPDPKTGVPDYGTPPVMKPVADYESFAVIYIPRLGSDWRRVIKESVDVKRVLNSEHSGIGHYPGTQMPGQVGNFAIAGHVDGWGNAFIDLHTLRIGDPIYIETKDGWYTYRFRDFEYVQPSAVQVLFPVPREPSAVPSDRILTMTTCNPAWHSGERLVTYSVFDSWQPLSAGAPAPIAAHVAKAEG